LSCPSFSTLFPYTTLFRSISNLLTHLEMDCSLSHHCYSYIFLNLFCLLYLIFYFYDVYPFALVFQYVRTHNDILLLFLFQTTSFFYGNLSNSLWFSFDFFFFFIFMTFIHLRLCFSMSAHTTIYCFFSFSKQHHFFMAIWTMRIGFSLNILFSFTFWILTNQHLSIFSFNFNHKFATCRTFRCG